MSEQNVLKRSPKTRKIKLAKDDRIFFAVCYVIILLLAVTVLYPLVYVIACSFSSGVSVSTGKVFLWPVDFSLEGYRRVFTYNGIWQAYLNTIFYTVAGTALHVAMTMICAYPMSKRGLPHKKAFMVFFTITMMFSGGMIPGYLLIRDLKMLNTVWAMIIPGLFSAYNMTVARTFITSTLPEDLWEATEIDGCDAGLFFIRFVLPLSKAVIAVVAMTHAIGVWNSYFNAMIYLSKENLYPLQIVLRNILIMSQVSLDDVDDETAAAMQGLADQLKYALIIVATVPIMSVYPFVQKYFVKGVMIGSLKG